MTAPFVVCTVSLLFLWVLHNLFFIFVRRANQAVFEEVCAPQIGGSNLDPRYWRLIGFIWSLKFLSLHDWKVSAVGFSMMLVEGVAIVSFGLLMLE